MMTSNYIKNICQKHIQVLQHHFGSGPPVVTITSVVGACDITTNVCGDKQNTLAPKADCYADLIN